ncbi:hypothetical protein ICV35_26795 [Rhodococcus ruber]|uniref:hypothetical protein n=1 Tax=Rhodococcus ruber TaxID=1830 RepID=UPI00177A9A41|nr:hypothetical protein [Rhodococcus ruber]MBD8057249.1 hypothetical protein [Rhodococcus ruber]
MTDQQGAESGYATRVEAAAFLGVRPESLRRYQVRGTGPACERIDGQVLYRWSTLVAYARAVAERKAVVLEREEKRRRRREAARVRAWHARKKNAQRSGPAA